MVNQRKVNSTYRPIALIIYDETMCIIPGMIFFGFLANEADSVSLPEREGESDRCNCGLPNSEKAAASIECSRVLIDGEHDRLNYRLIHSLREHSGYTKYIHRFGLVESPNCPEYATTPKHREHIIFHCWIDGRVNFRFFSY